MRTTKILLAVTLCAASYTLVGCVGELIEIKPEADDLGVVSTNDGGDDLEPVEMGPVEPPHFFPDIQADLDAKNCAIAGCHGAGSNPPTFVKNPMTDVDKNANYDTFKTASINAAAMADPTMSPMLKLMLPGGTHLGGQQLMSTSDPVYKRWLAWIAGGGLK